MFQLNFTLNIFWLSQHEAGIGILHCFVFSVKRPACERIQNFGNISNDVSDNKCFVENQLATFLSRSKSHFIVGNALMEGLAKAGHEVAKISSIFTFLHLLTHVCCLGDDVISFRAEKNGR